MLAFVVPIKQHGQDCFRFSLARCSLYLPFTRCIPSRDSRGLHVLFCRCRSNASGRYQYVSVWSYHTHNAHVVVWWHCDFVDCWAHVAASFARGYGIESVLRARSDGLLITAWICLTPSEKDPAVVAEWIVHIVREMLCACIRACVCVCMCAIFHQVGIIYLTRLCLSGREWPFGRVQSGPCLMRLSA